MSDNGQTFKSAARTIKAMLKHSDVQQCLSGVGVQWSFNIEKAPWWGGVFERMVRMTKRCLKKVVGRAKLTYDELTTVVTEVEAVLNSRPLTYVSADDIEEPLTPAHLLTGRRLLSLPDTIYCSRIEEEFEATPQLLTKILNGFWKHWRSEYLVELRDVHRHTRKTSKAEVINVRDIVLVHDEAKPRGFWRLGCVTDLVVGRDGQTRGAVLKVASSGSQATTLQRPLRRLYPLEIQAPDREKGPGDNPEPDGTTGMKLI